MLKYKCNGCKRVYSTKYQAEGCCTSYQSYSAPPITVIDDAFSTISLVDTISSCSSSSDSYSGGGGSFDGGGCSSDY